MAKRRGRNVDPRIAGLERTRQSAGMSHAELCAIAGVSMRTWSLLRHGRRAPRAGTLKRLKSALNGRMAASGHALEAVAALHRAVTAMLAQAAGLDAALVARQDPAANAPLNPTWRAAALIRRQASYLLNLELELPGPLIGSALGSNRQNVKQARDAVEAARQGDRALAARLDAVAELVRGRA